MKENIFFPNTTQVPNFVFDVLMSRCASHPARLFILLAIIRKTYGWQKHEDLLSLSQIMELTGKDKKTVKTCLKFWQKEKVIQLVSKGAGRKISKYRCILYDYIDTERVRNESLEGSPLPLRESTITPLEGSLLPPQKQLNQLTKTNIQNIPTLSEQLKEFAKNNNLVYEINTREDQKSQSKLVTELSITNENVLAQLQRLQPILKDTNCDWWTKTNSFGFNFMLKNWGRIDAWHHAKKSNVVKLVVKPAPVVEEINSSDYLKQLEGMKNVI